MLKVGRLYELCQTREDYRQLWERQVAEKSLCRDWRDLGNGVFVCPHCEQPIGGTSLEEIRPRECRGKPMPAMATAPTVAPKGGCCGGGAAPRASVVDVPAPTLAQKASTFAAAIFQYAAEPGLVTGAEAKARLDICEECKPWRDGHSCTVCGCYLPVKARGKAWHCPLAKWPGDEVGWTPSVHANLLAQTVVVVPYLADRVIAEQAYAKMNNDCESDCGREGNAVRFDGRLTMTWGEKCNDGMQTVLDECIDGDRWKYVVLLNNDTRLSPNFFAGLITAQRATGAAAVTASYNVGWFGQKTRDGYNGPAEHYKPNPFHKWAGYCDGTCVLLTVEAIRAVGTFDLSVSPKYGWGLMADWAMRAKQLGYRIAHTEAAYVYHANMQTAQTVFGSVERYVSEAKAESDEGMRHKWGPNAADIANAIDLVRTFPKRNLIYHVAPFKGTDAWKRNLEQLAKRWDVFTGRKIITVAAGDEMEATGDVSQFLRSLGIPDGAATAFRVPNSRTLRENVNFLAMMNEVASTDPEEITFFAHAKGTATHGDVRGVMLWRNAMYHALLDDMPAVEKALGEKPIVGTHRRHERAAFPDGTPECDWHFAGTFFWFRNQDVFSRPAWQDTIYQTGWGVEAWPGHFFKFEDSACLDYDQPANMYDPKTYAGRGIVDGTEPTTSAAVKVELGGGSKPRADGFLNIDQCATADIQMELDSAGVKLPFADGSVDMVYSSHMFEHIFHLKPLLWEVVRVCCVGAQVEIVVPYWLSAGAMLHGHRQTIPPEQAEHWGRESDPVALEYWWKGSPKRLKLNDMQFVKGDGFDFWKRQWAMKATDEEIMRYCPDACHEVRYYFNVVRND